MFEGKLYKQEKARKRQIIEPVTNFSETSTQTMQSFRSLDNAAVKLNLKGRKKKYDAYNLKSSTRGRR